MIKKIMLFFLLLNVFPLFSQSEKTLYEVKQDFFVKSSQPARNSEESFIVIGADTTFKFIEITAKNYTIEVIDFVEVNPQSLEQIKNNPANANNSFTPAKPGFFTNQFSVETKELPPIYYKAKRGLAAGALVIPFRLMLNSERITAGGTIGGYVGYMINVFDVPITGFITSGLTSVPTSTLDSTDTSTEWGLTIGAGASAQILKKINFGIVFGFDKSESYDWEPWLSINIGTPFPN